MSVAQFMMAWGWLFSDDLKGRVTKLLKNRLAWVLMSLYVLHVVFLINTNDFEWAFKDLRIKLPLLLIPLYLASGPPVSLKEVKATLWVFIVSVFVASIVSTYLVMFKGLSEPKEISVFISHIRFSLEVCLAIGFLVMLAIKSSRTYQTIGAFALALWFLIFLFILRAFTGFLVFAIVLWIGSLYAAFVSRRFFASIAWVLVFTALSLTYGFSIQYLKVNFLDTKPVDPLTLAMPTPDGNTYTHDTLNNQTIRGHRMWQFLCEDEMRYEWNRRSQIPYDGLCPEGQPLRDVLIRYLTSKGWHKDGQSVRNLSEQEVEEIGHGKAFYSEGLFSHIAERISETNWSYQIYLQNNDATGNSMIQRFELWKTGLALFKSHPIFGVGTGDVKEEFAQTLVDKGSSLAGSPLRAHNQWLTFGIAFGIVGLLWAFFVFLYPLFAASGFKSPMYFIFFLIIIFSMMAEDTLETQAGVTLVAFFNALLLFFPNLNPKHSGKDVIEKR